MLTYRLAGMLLWLSGAGSAGQLANKTAWLGVGDELDKHAGTRVEAPTADLLRDRLKEQTGSKLILLSTPTLETGQIHQEHETGSRHKLFVPCPECGHMQYLRRQGLRYDHCKDLLPPDETHTGYDLARVLRETYYECEACCKPIPESKKRWMIDRRKILPTNFRTITDPETGEKRDVPNWTPGKMSYQHSDLYSFNPKVSWGVLAQKWILARGKPGKLQAVLNSNFGEVFRETVADIGEAHINRLRGAYKAGSLPLVPCILLMNVDNQGDRKKWVRFGMTKSGDMWVVDWGECADLDAAEEISLVPVRCGDKELVVQRGLIDEGGSGGTSYEVREFCHRHLGKWFPSKGRGRGQIRQHIVWTESEIAKSGGEKIAVVHYDDDAYKYALYIERIRRLELTGESSEENDTPRAQRPVKQFPRIWIPENASQQFKRELCGERRERKEDKLYGGHRLVWVQSPPNDFGDCCKMGLVLWDILSPFFQQNPAAPHDAAAAVAS